MKAFPLFFFNTILFKYPHGGDLRELLTRIDEGLEESLFIGDHSSFLVYYIFVFRHPFLSELRIFDADLGSDQQLKPLPFGCLNQIFDIIQDLGELLDEAGIYLGNLDGFQIKSIGGEQILYRFLDIVACCLNPGKYIHKFHWPC